MMENTNEAMNEQVLGKYAAGFELTGSLLQDVGTFFKLHQDTDTWEHTLKVTSHAVRIARLYGADPQKAEQAALLHDVSNVIPVSRMLETAEEIGIKIEDEERTYPRILHQKLSRAMAEQLFHISDEEILRAIECHTTLKPHAALFDKVVFIADKVSWDLPGDHPYLNEVRRQVDEHQLDKAVFAYLDHVWSQRDKMKLVHSWLIQAREELLELAENETDPVKRYLMRVYDHMSWANREIINRLQEEQNVPERPLSLFAHILSAEAVWLSRLNGSVQSTREIWPSEGLNLQYCIDLALVNAEGYRQYFANLGAGQLKGEVSYRSSKGEPFTSAILDILTHVSLHGSYHRGQIATHLRMENITPPMTDYILYARNEG